ncbi:MAG: hypothetical protein MJY99_07065 [Fibrobacter sp.]|nr:hypothetical protein [Fibrobacter sp.]
MLKKEDKQLIRDALMEYRSTLFNSFHGTDEEKQKLAHLNKLLQSWKV